MSQRDGEDPDPNLGVRQSGPPHAATELPPDLLRSRSLNRRIRVPEQRSLRVLAIDPFHGGSHREFLISTIKRSHHQWSLVTGKPVHWKWRMRSAPLELAAAASRLIQHQGPPDLIFCTDMLDLAQWRGLLRDPRVLTIPTAMYFHESQWNYPISPKARVDLHYGYTNLISALAADACWFNSAFHRDDFLKASESFVARMPDAKQCHDVPNLRKRCRVLPPGFEAAESQDREFTGHRQTLTIGWVSRWEHDKRPDRFHELLSLLEPMNVDFELVLLGPRPPKTPGALQEIREHFATRIIHDGLAESTCEYQSWLRRIDVIVSTADHEFFGIAACESIWAGAAPVLPNRLSYPELVPRESLYDSIDDAARMIGQLRVLGERAKRVKAARAMIEPLRRKSTVRNLDAAISALVAAKS